MKSKNLWPELIALILMLSIAWGLLKLSFAPAAALIDSLQASTSTSTPTPITTSALPPATTYLKIPVEQVAQLENFAAGVTSEGIARMILVTKQSVTTANGETLVRHESKQICVSVQAFLEENGQANAYSKDKTKNVLI